MPPVLGGKIIIGQQDIPILSQTLCRFGVFGLVYLNEVIKVTLGIILVVRMPYLMKFHFGLWLNALRQFVENIGCLVNPAPLPTTFRINLGNSLPESKGTVTHAGWSPGLGNTVEIDHGYGYVTCYGHASRLLVRRGQVVTRGEVIAQVGSSGISTSPHLHYEVRVGGTAVNPMMYVIGNVLP